MYEPSPIYERQSSGRARQRNPTQAFGDEWLATGVVRGYRGAEDQFLRQVQDFGHADWALTPALSR